MFCFATMVNTTKRSSSNDQLQATSNLPQAVQPGNRSGSKKNLQHSWTMVASMGHFARSDQMWPAKASSNWGGRTAGGRRGFGRTQCRGRSDARGKIGVGWSGIDPIWMILIQKMLWSIQVCWSLGSDLSRLQATYLGNDQHFFGSTMWQDNGEALSQDLEMGKDLGFGSFLSLGASNSPWLLFTFVLFLFDVCWCLVFCCCWVTKIFARCFRYSFESNKQSLAWIPGSICSFA